MVETEQKVTSKATAGAAKTIEGSVKWFSRDKGYGFIAGDDGNEYFVHNSALAPGTFIRDNDKVSFEPAEGDKGKQARNVKLLMKGSERTDIEE
jgi:CspA family cold shock protein